MRRIILLLLIYCSSVIVPANSFAADADFSAWYERCMTVWRAKGEKERETRAKASLEAELKMKQETDKGWGDAIPPSLREQTARLEKRIQNEEYLDENDRKQIEESARARCYVYNECANKSDASDDALCRNVIQKANAPNFQF